MIKTQVKNFLLLSLSTLALANCAKEVSVRSKNGGNGNVNANTANNTTPEQAPVSQQGSGGTTLNGTWTSDSYDINDMTFTRLIISGTSIRIQECEMDDYCPTEYVGVLSPAKDKFASGYSVEGDYQDINFASYHVTISGNSYPMSLYMGLANKNGKTVLLYTENINDVYSSSMVTLEN